MFEDESLPFPSPSPATCHHLIGRQWHPSGRQLGVRTPQTSLWTTPQMELLPWTNYLLEVVLPHREKSRLCIENKEGNVPSAGKPYTPEDLIPKYLKSAIPHTLTFSKP